MVHISPAKLAYKLWTFWSFLNLGVYGLVLSTIEEFRILQYRCECIEAALIEGGEFFPDLHCALFLIYYGKDSCGKL